MKKITPIAILLLYMLSAVRSSAQTDAQIAAIVAVTGAEEAEALDAEEIERYLSFMLHPLDLNGTPRGKLLSCGFLTPFQVASLEDYRKRCGDVLSVTELSLIEGFGEEFSRNLAPFVSLSSRSLPGHPAADTMLLRNTVISRASLKGDKIGTGLKLKSSFGESVTLSFAEKDLQSWGGAISWAGGRWPGKFLVGDFNARFGQGLALWSGMSLSGFSSVSSICRNGAGISPSWSYSGAGTYRGVAADFQVGRFVISSFAAFPGLKAFCEGNRGEVSFMPGGNVSWYGKSGQLGLTAFWLSERIGGDPNGLFYQAGGKVSVDGKLSWRGMTFFGESAFDCYSGSAAGAGGLTVPFLDGWRFGLAARFYPASFSASGASGIRAWTGTSNEKGVVLGVGKRNTSITADIAAKWNDPSVMQVKVLAKVPFQLTPAMVLSLRVSERFRPYEPVLVHRAGARADLDWSSSGLSAAYGEPEGNAWKARLRLEGLYCRAASGLAYLEGGRKTDRFSAYLRSTFFLVDNWDDRIYSYERDAPGNFTVPAYYGKGYSLSAVASAKFRFRLGGRRLWTLRLYSRASMVRYPFMEQEKPAGSELKFQVQLEV